MRHGPQAKQLAKCIMGYDRADAGRFLLDEKPRRFTSPRAAQDEIEGKDESGEGRLNRRQR